MRKRLRMKENWNCFKLVTEIHAVKYIGYWLHDRFSFPSFSFSRSFHLPRKSIRCTKNWWEAKKNPQKRKKGKKKKKKKSKEMPMIIISVFKSCFDQFRLCSCFYYIWAEIDSLREGSRVIIYGNWFILFIKVLLIRGLIWLKWKYSQQSTWSRGESIYVWTWNSNFNYRLNSSMNFYWNLQLKWTNRVI